MITVEVEVKGIQGVINGLNNLKTNISNAQEPLTKSGKYMQMEAAANFPEEGKRFGEPWKELTKETLRRKKKEGYEGMPMMLRKGELKKSFFFNVSKNKAEVYNPVSYATEHQNIGVGYKLTKRVLLKLAKRQIIGIRDIFTNWIVGSIKKSFSSK